MNNSKRKNALSLRKTQGANNPQKDDDGKMIFRTRQRNKDNVNGTTKQRREHQEEVTNVMEKVPPPPPDVRRGPHGHYQ